MEMANGLNGLQESTRLNERKLLKAERQEGKGHHNIIDSDRTKLIKTPFHLNIFN